MAASLPHHKIKNAFSSERPIRRVEIGEGWSDKRNGGPIGLVGFLMGVLENPV